MFPSTDTVNAFPRLSSSYNPPPCTNVNETNDIFLYHHHNPLTTSLLSTNIPVTQTELNMATSSEVLMTKPHIDALNGNHCNASNFLPSIRPVKKDKHRKIYTAQGLRDRRVRLSIEIARKFFDLQDMLGFDKASKTLDWLLNKSRKAIKQLAQNGCARSLSSASATEGASENGGQEERIVRNEQLGGVSDEKMMTKLKKSAVNLVAKESRAKARARARERTRMKMCIQESKKCPDSNPHTLNQSRSLSQRQACDKSGSSHISSTLKVIAQEGEGPSSPSLANRVPNETIIEKSILITGKLKRSTTMVNRKNLSMLKGASSNHNNNCLPYGSQYWEINTTPARSSVRIFTSTNLSTELQLYGKLWEAENNQSLH